MLQAHYTFVHADTFALEPYLCCPRGIARGSRSGPVVPTDFQKWSVVPEAYFAM